MKKRINFEIQEEILKELKMIALKRNITLKELMLREIARLLSREKKYD